MAKSSEGLHGLLMSRLKLSEKFAKKYFTEADKALKDYKLESFDDLIKTLNGNEKELWNRLQVPYIFSTVESAVPALFDSMPPVIIQQGGKRDQVITEFADSVWSYLVRKLDLKSVVQDVGFMFILAGVGSLRHGWRVETEIVEDKETQPIMDELGQPVIDEMGQPVTQEILKPREVITVNLPTVSYNKYKKVLYSPESYFVIDDQENLIPYIIIEESMTPDEIEYKYGVKVEKPEYLDLKDIDKGLDSTSAEGLEKDGIQQKDLERMSVYTYHGTLPKRFDKENWKPNKNYKLVFTKEDVIKKPEPVAIKPILQVGNYGSPEEFWKFGEAKVLRELETDVSFGRSVMSDYRDRLATKVAIPGNAEFDEESFKSPKDFTFVKFIGEKFPQYITPPPVPEVVLNALNMSREDIQMTSGQLDIARGGTTNTVDTATGQKIFQNVHEKRIGRKREKIGSLMIALATRLLVDCAKNWDIDTFIKITDMEEQFITENQLIEKLQQVGDEYDLVIDIESVMNNKEAESAQAIALYKELKDRMEVNQEELIKHAVKVGFRQKDPERFLSSEMTPEQMVKSLEQMVNMGIMAPEMAQEHLQAIMATVQAEQSGQNNVGGRPMTQSPVDVAAKSMPGADSTQISAQNQVAYKQQGVPK